VNVVALCDVLPSRTNKIMQEAKNRGMNDVRVFDDFRKMFDKVGKQIDACTVGTPDHSHFPISMLAMSLGKHIYVEKPLAHTFEECELMMKAEAKYKVACQMGNQGHSGNQRRQFEQWVERGIIKDVKKIDAWMNKKRRWWGWGKVADYPKGGNPPEGMNWDVWAGTAPLRPYDGKYDPGNWRGWFDYGCGAFGDWGPHILDSIHRYLKLGLPEKIRAVKFMDPTSPVVYPKGSTIGFDFAARENMPACAITWYDGPGNVPKLPEGYTKGHGSNRGKFIYCANDVVIKGGSHTDTHHIIKGDVDRAKLKLTGKAETSTNHMTNFINAAMGKEECNSKFSVSAPLTQVFMLGCIAQELGTDLEFDTKKKKITNNKKANELLKRPPRKGWEEYYKL
ncbi:oxidoreductase, partial [bacterium B17]